MATSWGTEPWLLSEQPSSTTKRLRSGSDGSTDVLRHEDYTVGWISALPLEMTAAEVMLDYIHEPLPQHPQDSNSYTLGCVDSHNVVIACLPKGQYGSNNAATVASHMARSFPNIHHRLLVGIGGGVPGIADIRLGDVVVSTEVVQYDLGKAMPDSKFQRITHPVRPPHSIMTAVSKLQASHSRDRTQMSAILLERSSRLSHYSHPMLQDRLFRSHYNHVSKVETCDNCDQSQLVLRQMRQNTDPIVHYGRIASGNQVIKDGYARDELSKELCNICFEMEAAGLMDSSPCLIIRGICDYSDSHKNKQWQEYAALVAAAYAKELLSTLPTHIPITQTIQPWKRRKAPEPKVPESPEKEVNKCLQAMFITDASQDRDDILDAKGDICKGTCEWILLTQEFKMWDLNPPHLLWISAPPGMGKTFLSIYLSKYFERVSEQHANIATIFFLCDNKLDTRNTAINILRSLIYQLISCQSDLIYTIIPQWRQKSSELFRDSSFSTLWRLFEEMVDKSAYNSIYCVIDALDECEGDSLNALLRKFERLSKGTTTSPTKMKLVCLSRRFPERIPESLMLFTKIELDMMVAGKEDVRRFISERVFDLARKKNLSPSMRTRIEEIFQQRSEGTFLWISFMAQDLEQKRLLDIETSLDMLPGGLDAVYDRILTQIDFDKRDMIFKMLGWILVAARPLRIPELCEAMEVKRTQLLPRETVCLELVKACGHLLQLAWNYSGSEFPWREAVQPNPESVSHPETKSDTEFELIHKQRSELNDNKQYSGSDISGHGLGYRGSMTQSGTKDNVPDYWLLEVTFLHQSAKDYFIKSRQISGWDRRGYPIFQLHESVTNQLIQYLDNINRHPRVEARKIIELMEDQPLASYAIRNWHFHFKESRDIIPIIQQNGDFFDENSKTRASWHALRHTLWSKERATIPLLHMCCYLGLSELAKWCLEEKEKVYLEREWGIWGHKPLHIACDVGNEAMATLLLDAGADAVSLNYHSRTPLSFAVQRCGRNLLRRMTQQESCRDWLRQETRDNNSKLLHFAAEEGNEDTCRFLVEECLWDVNCGYMFAERPVMCAVQWGHSNLARIFTYEWHAHIDDWMALDDTFRPWHRSQFERVIRFLVLDLAVDINAVDWQGNNVLRSLFRQYGRYRNLANISLRLDLLLQLGCNFDQPNYGGQTPLHYAAMDEGFVLSSSFTSAMAFMVCQAQLDINQVCPDGQNILHYLIVTFSSLTAQVRAGDIMNVPESMRSLLDLGIDRGTENKRGCSALRLLRPSLHRTVESWGEEGVKYKQAANRMITLLESYSTVSIQ